MCIGVGENQRNMTTSRDDAAFLFLRPAEWEPNPAEGWQQITKTRWIRYLEQATNLRGVVANNAISTRRLRQPERAAKGK